MPSQKPLRWHGMIFHLVQMEYLVVFFFFFFFPGKSKLFSLSSYNIQVESVSKSLLIMDCGHRVCLSTRQLQVQFSGKTLYIKAPQPSTIIRSLSYMDRFIDIARTGICLWFVSLLNTTLS